MPFPPGLRTWGEALRLSIVRVDHDLRVVSDRIFFRKDWDHLALSAKALRVV